MGGGTFGCEEEKEQLLDDITDMLRWMAKRLGYNDLGEDNLQQHKILEELSGQNIWDPIVRENPPQCGFRSV